MPAVAVPSFPPPTTTVTAAMSELEILRLELAMARTENAKAVAEAERAKARADKAQVLAEQAQVLSEARVAKAEKAVANECSVCMAASCDVAIVPCGHVCCCEGCAEKLKECPQCRVAVEGRQRVYLACLMPAGAAGGH